MARRDNGLSALKASARGAGFNFDEAAPRQSAPVALAAAVHADWRVSVRFGACPPLLANVARCFFLGRLLGSAVTRLALASRASAPVPQLIRGCYFCSFETVRLSFSVASSAFRGVPRDFFGERERSRWPRACPKDRVLIATAVATLIKSMERSSGGKALRNVESFS